jgi:hypothetical protein
MSCFGRFQHRQEVLEQARREIEAALLFHGFEVVEAQDLGHSIVFKIRKTKRVEAKNSGERKT